MSPEAIATMAAAFLALIGTVIMAVSQYKAAVDTKRSKALEDAKAEARENKEKLEAAERQRTLDSVERQILDLSRGMDENFGSLGKDISEMGRRIDAVSETVDKRLSEQDEKLQALSDRLGETAREYSMLMSLHRQMETRIEGIIEIENYNLAFSKRTSASLEQVEELLHNALKRNEAAVDETEKLAEIIDDTRKNQTEFFNNVVGVSMDYMKPKSDEAVH